jgi:hypothetical protein
LKSMDLTNPTFNQTALYEEQKGRLKCLQKIQWVF